MSRDDQRWPLALVFGLMLYITGFWLWDRHGVVALWSAELSHDERLQHHLLARKNIAAVIQAIGALIAFYGLLRAYIRSKYDEPVWRWIKEKVRPLWGWLCRGTSQTIGPSGIATGATFGWHAVAHGLVQHNVDIALPLQEQINRLVMFVNNRASEAVEMEKKITGLEKQLRGLKSRAVELERNLLEHIETQIQQLDNKLNRVQVLDLTLAIWGLLISFFGTVWGLGV